MNTVRVKVDVHQSNKNGAVIPVNLPSLDDVRALATRLHVLNTPFNDLVWGWPVYYDPELKEDYAELEVTDAMGGHQTEVVPFWSPASFTIGESGVWFFSMTWEHGREQPPVEFLDDRNILDR